MGSFENEMLENVMLFHFHQIEWTTFSMNELKFIETHSERSTDTHDEAFTQRQRYKENQGWYRIAIVKN